MRGYLCCCVPNRRQPEHVVYAISDKPLSDEEWSKRYVTPHQEVSGPTSERNGRYRHSERTKAAIAEQRKFSAFAQNAPRWADMNLAVLGGSTLSHA